LQSEDFNAMFRVRLGIKNMVSVLQNWSARNEKKVYIFHSFSYCLWNSGRTREEARPKLVKPGTRTILWRYHYILHNENNRTCADIVADLK